MQDKYLESSMRSILVNFSKIRLQLDQICHELFRSTCINILFRRKKVSPQKMVNKVKESKTMAKRITNHRNLIIISSIIVATIGSPMLANNAFNSLKLFPIEVILIFVSKN